MTPSELEKHATQKARTVDPSVLPFATSAAEWQTWLGPQGQWIFIEKAGIKAVANAFGFSAEEAFQFIGEQMLIWLAAKAAKVKPREIWKIEFDKRQDTPVNFGIFQNQCFVFMPRKIA